MISRAEMIAINYYWLALFLLIQFHNYGLISGEILDLSDTTNVSK